MYFNHAFKKCFVATSTTLGGVSATVVNGILTTPGVHVSELKNQTTPYQLGPGVVGLFDAKTHLSVLGADIATGCCPFYIAAASIRTNDKQGPFHGGYQESNKSKVINPRFIRKMYKVDGNAGSQAIIEIGGTVGNAQLGMVLTLDAGSLTPGTGYTTAVGVATTGGSGTGLTVNITALAGNITEVTINNPGVGYTIDDIINITGGNSDADIMPLTVSTVNVCEKEFMCGESYNLRIDVKGTSVLRFANHNVYRTLMASGGCCEDPANPVAIDPSIIYLQWATQISEDNYLKPLVMAILEVDGDNYAYNQEQANLLGLPAAHLYSDAPTTSTTAGIVLVGAYVETQFGNCTFTRTDYYQTEPLLLFASLVDLNGDPCTFEQLCITDICKGVQVMGLGSQKIREVILSESYMQNFMADDFRIREITQGNAIFDVLSANSLYSSFFLLHSVPRYSNPSGTFDNDQYLLEIIGTPTTMTILETQFQEIIDAGCMDCTTIEDFTQSEACDYEFVGGYALPTIIGATPPGREDGPR